MKQLLFATIALSLLLCACHEEENEPTQERRNELNISSIGMMLDAANIIEMQMYCMEFNPVRITDAGGLYSQYHSYAYKYGDKFTNYKKVGIYVGVKWAGNGLSNDTAKVGEEINTLVKDWYNRRSHFILDELNGRRLEQVGWQSFFTAYVNGSVQLTCDKVLFGQQSGEDLSQHFFVIPYNMGCLPIGRETPEMQYAFEDSEKLRSGIPMTDFFKKDTWIQFGYLLGFMDEPTERYDELTFTLTFPASLEHVRDFVTSAYNGENAPMKVTDPIYTASFTAKFNWE